MIPLSLALPLVLVLYLSKFKVDDRHGSMLIYLNVFVCVYFFFFFLGGKGEVLYYCNRNEKSIKIIFSPTFEAFELFFLRKSQRDVELCS